MTDYSITFASPLVDTEALKRLAVFFDRIELPLAPWGWASITPQDAEQIQKQYEETGIAGPTVGVVHGVLGAHLLGGDPEIGLLIREGVVAVETPPLELMEEIEETTPLYDYFDTQVEDGKLWLHEDGKLLMDGCSRVLDCVEINADDYCKTFYFLSLAAYARMAVDPKPLVTDSTTINDMLRFAHRSAESRLHPTLQEQIRATKHNFFVTEIGRIMLPNIEVAAVEDILELRVKLSDELEAFRAQVSALATEIEVAPGTAGFEGEVLKIIESKVLPSIVDIEAKLRLSRDRLLLRIARSLKKPDAYVPLLSSLFLNVPVAVAALASAGIVLGEALLETRLESSETKQQGNLAFLIEARRRLR